MNTSGSGESKKAGDRQSWLTGLGLAVPGAFLMLEFPLFGLALLVAVIALVSMAGRAIAGVGGLFVGIGGTWVALFGRVALECRADSGCTAPGIGSAVATSAGVLAIGALISIVAVVRARRS
ncbi:MAG: hypothetical protein HY264_08480 [Chloroflexi bacterium]|nr:hypothetical protein [Chloroflexota bacterium]